MAYTYDDFAKKATEKGMLGQYSAQELDTAQKRPEYGLATLKTKEQAANAKTPEQKLIAEQTETEIKKGYLPNFGKPFEYGRDPDYQAALDKVIGRQDFTWDPDTDPRYAQYRKAYAREGDRAQSNALAKTANMTGGVPSSYATGAAAQAGNYYAAKTADVIPSLYQAALGEYFQKANQNLQDLQALGNDRNFAYQAYLQAYQKALQAYQMGERTQEIADILGTTYKKPGMGGGAPGGGGGWSWNQWSEDARNNGVIDYNGNYTQQTQQSSPSPWAGLFG